MTSSKDVSLTSEVTQSEIPTDGLSWAFSTRMVMTDFDGLERRGDNTRSLMVEYWLLFRNTISLDRRVPIPNDTYPFHNGSSILDYWSHWPGNSANETLLSSMIVNEPFRSIRWLCWRIRLDDSRSHIQWVLSIWDWSGIARSRDSDLDWSFRYIPVLECVRATRFYSPHCSKDHFWSSDNHRRYSMLEKPTTKNRWQWLCRCAHRSYLVFVMFDGIEQIVELNFTSTRIDNHRFCPRKTPV